jgi:hypothetical protein
MKSPSLDKLYTQLNKHILLAQSYTEVPELFFIIKSCRLKPNDYVFKGKSSKVVLYRDWFDEFGNGLKIKDKKLNLIYNSLSLETDKIICTDLYYGLSLKNVIKISKLMYLCAGLDEDIQQDCFFLTLLGLDNYLRSYLYLYGEWQQVSSLLLGLNNLKILARHTDMQYFRKLSNKKDWPIPCSSAMEVLTCLPMSSALMSDLKKQSDKIADVLVGT